MYVYESYPIISVRPSVFQSTYVCLCMYVCILLYTHVCECVFVRNVLKEQVEKENHIIENEMEKID